MVMVNKRTILKQLNKIKPMATRKLMKACSIKVAKGIGKISDEELEFCKKLCTLADNNEIMLIPEKGWILP